MKSVLALALPLLPLFSSVMAAPTPGPEPLPAGWTPISSVEVQRRMNTSPSDPAAGLLKRTPGNVCTRLQLQSSQLAVG